MDLIRTWKNFLISVLKRPSDTEFAEKLSDKNVVKILEVILSLKHAYSEDTESKELFHTIFLIFHRTSKITNTIVDFPSALLLIDFTKTYFYSNENEVKEIVATFINNNSKLELDFFSSKSSMVDYLKWLLKRHEKASYSTMSEVQQKKYRDFFMSVFESVGTTLDPLFSSSSSINKWFNSTPDLVSSLLALYNSFTRFMVSVSPTELSDIKLSFLSSIHQSLNLNFIEPLLDPQQPLSLRITLFDQLYNILKKQIDLENNFISDIPFSQALFNAPASADLTIIHNYIHLIQSIIERSDDEFLSARKTRVEFLISLLYNSQENVEGALPPPPENDSPPAYASSTEVEIEDNQLDNSNESAILESKVSQVLDIFPDFSAGYVKACLKRLNLDPELLIGKILENDLPFELKSLDTKMADEPTVKPVNEQSLLSQRRNIHDNDEFDVFASGNQKIQKEGIYKKNITKKEHSIAPPSEVKKSVIQLAFNQYEDEYDDSYDQDILAPMEPDSTPIDPSVQFASILYASFSENPDLFSRAKESRNSKARLVLREQTGMTDEQIEGWAIMLSRDPKRKQALEAQHGIYTESFTQNSLQEPTKPQKDKQPQSTRDKAYKERHKSTTANHRRKDLHTRKMNK